MIDPKEKVKKLRKLIPKSFAERMLKFGFDRHSGGVFYRKTDFGRVGITLFYNNRYDALKIEASASVKVDEAENILFEYRTKVRVEGYPPTKPNASTVSENLGNIKSKMWRMWYVYNEPDVEEALGEIEALVVAVGLPFLEKFGKPEIIIQEIIESRSRKSVLGHPVHRFSHFFAIALALNRRDIFDEMRPVFEDMLRNHSQFRFENILQYLDWIESKFSEK